jgi:putative ABC transport system permease protein
MDKWLQDYKYKTDITWEVFFIAGGLAVVIALVTISYQAIRAALVSPVNSLRSE